MSADIISYDYFTARRIAKAVIKELGAAPSEFIMWEPPDFGVASVPIERLHADLFPPKERT